MHKWPSALNAWKAELARRADFDKRYPRPKIIREDVPLRLLSMPCCGYQLVWICERLPNYCPECGALIMPRLMINGVEPKSKKAVLEVHDEHT